MVGHGEAMAFIANLLHQVKHRRTPIQHDRLILLPIDVDDLLALRDRRQWLQRHANLLQRRICRMQLAQSSIDQNEGRERLLVFLQPLVTALNHLAHAGEVIDARDGLHLKLAVVGLLHRAILPHHHRGHRLSALNMRDVEALDAPRQLLQRQRVLQCLLNRLHPRLQHAKPLIVRLLRVLANQINERTFFASLRRKNLHAPARSLRQNLRQQRTIRKLHRHKDRSRHIALVQIDLFQQGREKCRRD